MTINIDNTNPYSRPNKVLHYLTSEEKKLYSINDKYTVLRVDILSPRKIYYQVKNNLRWYISIEKIEYVQVLTSLLDKGLFNEAVLYFKQPFQIIPIPHKNSMYDPNRRYITYSTNESSPAMVLGHELAHARIDAEDKKLGMQTLGKINNEKEAWKRSITKMIMAGTYDKDARDAAIEGLSSYYEGAGGLQKTLATPIATMIINQIEEQNHYYRIE